jgi:diguanylate cyclase (GGDEF)-like protein
LTLLMIDIDHFKAYNDHYGHQKGDQCLIQVAAALAGMLKRPCDLMARYGGEEFAMILPETDVEQAMLMADAIRARAQELAIPHERSSDPSQLVTVSIGVATQKPLRRWRSTPDRLRRPRAVPGQRGGRNRVATA